MDDILYFMKDIRVQKLAKVLVNYSLGHPTHKTVDVSGSSAAEPLLICVYEELLRAGAYPALRMVPDETQELFFKYGKKHHFDTLTSYQKALVRHADCTLRVIASKNTRALTDVDPSKQARLAQTMKPLKDAILKKPWTLTLFPTAAFAQDADMSLSDFEDFVYAATFADEKQPVRAWKALARRQEKLIQRLQGADRVRIVGPDTDISLSVKGRPFINSAGTRNMPSGEIFTSPIEDSAEGYICYDYPVCHQGREIEGIRLVFRNGRVVDAHADKNEAFLLKMLDMDKGARRLGELGIGTNFGIRRFIKNILFDEKIGGSIHLAVGAGFPEAGGKNKSALHWDMIKDLRHGGAMYVDGRLFQKEGRFQS
jgi:aminopeptidase